MEKNKIGKKHDGSIRFDPETMAGSFQAILEEEGIEYKIVESNDVSSACVFRIRYKEKIIMIQAWSHISGLYALRGWPKIELSDTDNEYMYVKAVNETNKKNLPKITYDFENKGGKKQISIWCTLYFLWCPGISNAGYYLKDNLDKLFESYEIFKSITEEQHMGLVFNENGKAPQYKA